MVSGENGNILVLSDPLRFIQHRQSVDHLKAANLDLHTESARRRGRHLGLGAALTGKVQQDFVASRRARRLTVQAKRGFIGLEQCVALRKGGHTWRHTLSIECGASERSELALGIMVVRKTGRRDQEPSTIVSAPCAESQWSTQNAGVTRERDSVRGTDDGRTGARGDDPLALKGDLCGQRSGSVHWNLQCPSRAASTGRLLPRANPPRPLV